MTTSAAVFSKKESRVFLWAVMAPTLAAFLAIRIVPILQTFVLSFFNWSLIDGIGQFVGIRNYAAVLNDPLFYDAFANTLILAAAGSILSVVLGLAFAVIIVNIAKAATYEAIIFFPVVLTYIPICMVWVWLFNWDNGLINYVLQQVGLPRVAWLGSKAMTMVSIIIISVWKVIGYYMIIFSVGLKAIPRTYYEAAVIDGATKPRIFAHVTLPLLKPVMLLACVIAVINFLKIFTQVYAVVGGQIGQAAHLGVLVYDIYNRAFTYFKLGEGAAESMLFLAVLMAFTLIQFKALGAESD